tara:strand:+ start:2245 stop:2967 length:723 start_codon:yes stop_codon:yes gene_type:complete
MKQYVARLIGFFATVPARVLQHKIEQPRSVSHATWVDYLSEHFNKPGVRVLEVGSRVVTGANFREKFDKADYIGFDFYAGENVDIVGDAHKLSTYFSSDEKFDLIFSHAVFEHLHMPWVAAEEINKILRIDGCVFIETHFSFSSHERPWHFFQFSEIALRALFSDAMGYELVDSGLSNPMFGFFAHSSDRHLRYRPIPELYCHSEILVRKVREVNDFDWRTVDIDDIVEGSRYPLNNQNK